MKKKTTSAGCAVNYPEATLCPLNQLMEGASGRVRRLTSTPELNLRLRELGIFEDQRVKVLARPSSLICQVCHCRLAISDRLAQTILVEPIPRQHKPPIP